MGVGYLTGQGGGGSNIKSVQRGKSTLAFGVVALNVVISTVDINKSIVKIYRKPTSSTAISAAGAMVKAKITTSVNLELSRIDDIYNGYDVDVYWEVVEFNNVKSLQKGDYVLTNPTTLENIAINAINMSKSIIFASWTTISTSTAMIPVLDIAYINTSTQVSVMSSGFTGTIHWQVIEFK